MKIKEKIKWRLNFLKKERENKTIRFIDYFLIFMPNSYIKKQKITIELKNILSKNNILNIKKLNNNSRLIEFENYKLIIPKNLIDNFLVSVIDFALPFLKMNINIDLYDIRREGPYEFKNCIVSEDDYVIDAGANLGLFSIIASKRVGVNGKIFAFEPVEKTNKLLEKNLELNNISNCKIIDYALGDENKDITIFIKNDKLDAASIYDKNSNSKYRVKQIKLDTFIENNKIKKLDFIKVDIEGSEKNFLKGAKNTIQKFKPKISICTYHLKDDPEYIENYLKSIVPEYKIVHYYKKLFAYLDK